MKKLGWSNIWRRYFPFPCNVFLCGSGRCSKSDFPSNWVRQRAQRTLHGQFPGPGPLAQTFLLHQITQVTNQANYTFSNFVTHSWELWPFFTIFWNEQIYIWTWYIISNSFAHQWLWRRLALLVVGNNPLSGWFWCRAGRQENTANQCCSQNDKKTKK